MMPVVLVRKACKHYGSKSNKVSVLQNLNMTVPKGIIYGLLGPSGCGKTTLLNCILGQNRLNEGHIWVLGGAPNSNESKVPGPQIGFMPQSPGIQDEYTTKETMQYFGGLAGMSDEKIKERMYFLQELLMLPNLNTRIGNLSGGQKRRVSFAVALIHEPELLILDEPTVGLDPLLRDSIWNYLYEITGTHQTTVILTTHYVDETRKAHTVGLLREGQLLAEESPSNLLARYGVLSLEDVFFNLSLVQDNQSCTETYNTLSIPVKAKLSSKKVDIKLSTYIKPLLVKNLQWLVKHPEILITAVVIPILQVILLISAIGSELKNLNIAVVNNETSMRNCSPITCNNPYLSCNFLHSLESKFILNYYETEDEAIRSVMHGDSHASVYLRHDYSIALQNRINKKGDLSRSYSSFEVYRDISNYPIAGFIKLELLKSFQIFVKNYSDSCGISDRSMSTTIKWNKPIYGKTLPHYGEYIVPGMATVSITFFAAWSTAASLMMELSNGVTERSLIMGVNRLHLLIAHAFSELVVVIVKMLTISTTIFVLIDIPVESVYIIVLFCGLMGVFGICYGFALPSLCSTDSLITFSMMGFLFPVAVLSGSIWPIEGMPVFLQRMAEILPFAGTADSVRSVMHRGWTLSHPFIYISILKILAWILVLLLITTYFLRFKRR